MEVEYWATTECGLAGSGNNSAQRFKQLLGDVGCENWPSKKEGLSTQNLGPEWRQQGTVTFQSYSAPPIGGSVTCLVLIRVGAYHQ